ncbi:MAG: [acyl-carrier-protein] S-malonyltransferase [Candidatus Margulisbacteria bacterium]|nr:[acyl-carrier-protein] S-malonyltransferase [Candidatus Margulisiibacteriota bacterium]
MTRIGFVFPGQGSQKVGMGKDLYDQYFEVRELFISANKVLGYDISSICFDGPDEILTQTANAQPAIFLVSAALLLLLKRSGIVPAMVAGHSLGEITAYYAAGVLSFEDALRVIQVRGAAMAASYPSDDSAMAAIMKVELKVIQRIVSSVKEGPVVAANLNCPGQIVISGKKAGVAEACELLSKEGGRAIVLNVSGAFHSPLMASGSQKLGDFLQDNFFSSAQIPVILNRTALSEIDATQLKENLSLQVISPVNWIGSIQYMAQHVDRLVECGPGKVLSGLCRKIVPELPMVSVSDLESIKGIENGPQ